MFYHRGDQPVAEATKAALLSFAAANQVVVQPSTDFALDRPGAITVADGQRIRILSLPMVNQPGNRVPILPWCTREVDQTMHDKYRRIYFVNGTEYAFKPPNLPEQLYLGFDGDETVFTVRLGDSMRKLLAAKHRKVSEADFLTLATRLAVDKSYHDCLVAMGGAGYNIVNFMALGMIDGVCEVCCGQATSRCAACAGAVYCGAAHQKEDWKAHKSWCKANRV